MLFTSLILFFLLSFGKVDSSFPGSETMKNGTVVQLFPGHKNDLGAFAVNPTDIPVIDIPELVDLMDEEYPGVRVINFWATWCKPCVEELPLFEKINKDPRFDHVEIILVSVDFIEDLDTRVKKFIDRKNIQSIVMLMKNTDYNSWIDTVDPSWSGAIPATLILRPGQGERRFYEKQFRQGELEQLLLEF